MGIPRRQSEVMVVEDDLEIREILREILEEAGYSVSWAANGREALARLKQGSAPQLILLDLMMPVMDGLQFRAAQRQDPSLAPIPVVVLSADQCVDAKVGEMQVDAYLAKPFELGKLIATVDRYC